MIAFLRHLFLDDFRLKLFSQLLAVLVWLTVTFASQREVHTDARVFSNLPVLVLASAEDVSGFRVSPETVDVTVRADAEIMQNLQAKDIRATVDLTGVAAAEDLRKPVLVSVPPAVALVRVTPQEVKVIFPPDR